jgi:O-antigen/teichoic acid export membrane protein
VVNQFAFPLWFFLLGKQHINSVISVGFALGSLLAIFVGANLAGHIGACVAIILSQISLTLAYILCAHLQNIAPWQRELSA